MKEHNFCVIKQKGKFNFYTGSHFSLDEDNAVRLHSDFSGMFTKAFIFQSKNAALNHMAALELKSCVPFELEVLML